MTINVSVEAKPLAFWSAADLAAAIRAGRITSRALLDHYLERVDRFNPALNAIIHLDVEAARARADAADQALARGEIWGPLHGLPITIKESHNVAGWPTTHGNPRWKDNRPSETAVVIARLRDAGAVIFGKTNVPIGLLDWQSYNAIHGTTHNPWRRGYTPGGSSGGSAAAVAAGLVAVELGSDSGGSIRFPAHYTGLFGHRPSIGIVPADGNLAPGTLLASEFAVSGPIARSARDLELILDTITAPSPADAKAWSVTLPPARHRAIGDFRVAAIYSSSVAEVDESYTKVLRAFVEQLRRAGVAVDEDVGPEFDVAEHQGLFIQLLRGTGSKAISDEVYHEAEHAARLRGEEHSFAANVLRATTQSHRAYLKALERRAVIRRRWAEFFERYEVLLAPVTVSAAFPIDEARPREERELSINGHNVDYNDQIYWAGIASLSGLPATVAPIGTTADGLPLGVQIIGPYLEDRTPLAFAAAVEPLYGFRAPPGYE